MIIVVLRICALAVLSLLATNSRSIVLAQEISANKGSDLVASIITEASSSVLVEVGLSRELSSAISREIQRRWSVQGKIASRRELALPNNSSIVIVSYGTGAETRYTTSHLGDCGVLHIEIPSPVATHKRCSVVLKRTIADKEVETVGFEIRESDLGTLVTEDIIIAIAAQQ